MPLLLIDLILGFVCLYFGYQIYFRNKFDFINDFAEKRRKGVVGEDYAKKIGKIFLIMGNFFIGVALIFIVIKVVKFLIISLFFLVGLTILLLIFNAVKNKFR